MTFARPKITLVLRDDLLAWQEINVAAFLTSGLAAAHPELIGDPYADADRTTYLSMFGHPVTVLVADGPLLATVRARAVGRQMAMSVYTADLFKTDNDVDNRAAVAAVHAEDLDLVGVGVVGERNAVDKVVKGSRLHP